MHVGTCKGRLLKLTLSACNRDRTHGICLQPFESLHATIERCMKLENLCNLVMVIGRFAP